MKLFTCLIAINIPQLSCWNVWNYADGCTIEQVICTYCSYFSIEFSINKTQVTPPLCPHSNSPAAFAKWSMCLWIKNTPLWLPPHFLFIIWSGCTLRIERAIVKGTGGKKKEPSNIPLVFEKSCVMMEMESTANLWWNEEPHSATGGKLSAARVLKNCCKASIFQTCCLHICRCTQRPSTWGAFRT